MRLDLSVNVGHVATLRQARAEGGLDLVGGSGVVRRAAERLREGGIGVSVLVDPDLRQAAMRAGRDSIGG